MGKEIEELKKLIQDETEKLIELTSRINELENKEKNNNKVWIPKEEEKYYYVTHFGTIEEFHWRNHDLDYYKLYQDNIFKTKEEAEFKLFKLKLEGKARKVQIENNDITDWNDKNKIKYFIYYSFKYERLDYAGTYTNRAYKLGVFTSKEICEKFIEDNKEDLIKYFTK